MGEVFSNAATGSRRSTTIRNAHCQYSLATTFIFRDSHQNQQKQPCFFWLPNQDWSGELQAKLVDEDHNIANNLPNGIRCEQDKAVQ